MECKSIKSACQMIKRWGIHALLLFVVLQSQPPTEFYKFNTYRLYLRDLSPRCCNRARAVRSQRIASAFEASDRNTWETAQSAGTSSPSSSLTSTRTGGLRRPAFPHTFSCARRYHFMRIAFEAALRYTGPQSGYVPGSSSSSLSSMAP